MLLARQPRHAMQLLNLALKFFWLIAVSDAFELQASARLLSTDSGAIISDVAGGLLVLAGGVVLPLFLTRVFATGRLPSPQLLAGEILGPLPLLRQRGAQEYGRTLISQLERRGMNLKRETRLDILAKSTPTRTDPAARATRPRKRFRIAGWRPPAAIARSAAGCSSASRTAAPSASVAIPIIR